jgi:hypothetical protein
VSGLTKLLGLGVSAATGGGGGFGGAADTGVDYSFPTFAFSAPDVGVAFAQRGADPGMTQNFYVNVSAQSLEPETAKSLILGQMPTILKGVSEAASRSRVYRAQLAGG